MISSGRPSAVVRRITCFWPCAGMAQMLMPASVAAQVFNRDIVPELTRIATAPNSLNLQLRAVFALRRAPTAEAQAALEVIARSAPRPPRT